MNLNSKQATFKVPVFCKDQAEDIRSIEDAANTALQNIHTLYNEIMTPKTNYDAYYEASVSDYSSDSASVSIGSKNGCYSCIDVPKSLPEELCSKCQKLVSLCSVCHKDDVNNPQNINKTFLQERSNSYPRVKPVHRNTSYHPERKYSHLQEQPAQRNISEERRKSHYQEDCGQKKTHNSEEARRNSQYPEEIQRNSQHLEEVQKDSHYSYKPRKNSHLTEEAQRISHYPEQPQRNSHQSEVTRRDSHYPEQPRKNSQHPEVTRRNSHYPEQPRKNSHYPEQPRKNSHYPEQPRKNSQHPEVTRRNSYYPEQPRKNSQHPEESQKDSHYPKVIHRNSYYPEEIEKNSLQQSKFSRSKSVQNEQNALRDFCQEERKSSYYPESITASNSEYDDFPSYTFKSIKESKIQFNITVPEPFSLSAENIRRQRVKEEKIGKLREEIDREIEKELNIKFSPKPVPKHVHLPLYGEMVKMNEQRKKERREKCIEILNEKTKPFNLSASTRTCVSKSKSMSNLSDDSKTFKAKPVPKNILSENISQKIKNKEEIRKLLIAQRADEMLRKSSLPFSPKSIPRSHSLYNVSDSSKSNINITKERIEAITKRLYSIKCQETIENWNNKILQNDLWNVEMYCSKKNYINESSNDNDKHKKLQKSALPFQNFPVRKTTATFLREKRIR